jgi:hypothetical protein
MAYTDKQKSYVDEFRKRWVTANLPQGRADPRDWTLNERERYNNALGNFIASNPQIFEREQVEFGKMVAASPPRDIEKFSARDAASIFFTEFGDQAERINPFSELNRTALWIVGGLVSIAAVAIIANNLTSTK